jgi:hypothetical protein
MFFVSVSSCAETLSEEVIQVLVQVTLPCVRSRTRIELLCKKSRGTRLYAYQTEVLDKRPICCHIIIRDSGSRQEGYRDCVEGSRKGQT